MVLYNISDVLINATNPCLNFETLKYSGACLQKWFCPQIPIYLRNAGIGILATEILLNILIWALGKWASRPETLEFRMEWKYAILYIPFDFQNPIVRAYWYKIIQELFTFACAVYMIIVISWTFG